MIDKTNFALAKILSIHVFLLKILVMRILLVSLFSFLLFSCGGSRILMTDMLVDVTILAHDSLQGRKVGTEYEKKAASYIAKRFKELRLQPKGELYYFQDFHFQPSNNPHQEAVYSQSQNSKEGRNVIGFLNNKVPTTVVIGAHYDHLGMGGSNSLYRGVPEIHNGADDNASGVAMMLNLAATLQGEDAPKNNNYLFIAFSGEEEGLLGSNYYTKNPTIDLSTANYMLNMDMVGRLNPEKVIAVYGVGTSPSWNGVVDANKAELKINKKESGVGPSDHTSFYLVDIPVLHFFTGQHEDYHRPSDDVEKINLQGMHMISEYIYEIIRDLDSAGKLVFTKTKNESEMVPDFKVTLGVVPDYLFDGEGMRIDGTSEDKPAQKAGMTKGDVVKKMGEIEIVDMMSYMNALSKFEKGQTIPVIIERDGKEMELQVTF